MPCWGEGFETRRNGGQIVGPFNRFAFEAVVIQAGDHGEGEVGDGALMQIEVEEVAGVNRGGLIEAEGGGPFGQNFRYVFRFAEDGVEFGRFWAV